MARRRQAEEPFKFSFVRSETPLGFAPLLISAGVVAPFAEELFFRGFLFGALRQVTRPRNVIIASAACFGLFLLVGQIIFVESGVNSTLEYPMDLILGYPTIRQADWLFDFPARRWAVTS